MKRPDTLNPGPQVENLPRQASKKVYQTYAWQKFREKMRQKRRKAHEQIVMDVFKANPDKNTIKDLQKFLDSDMPLCEINLKKGKIKVANVLDHKMRIRKGGAVFNQSNVQWITEHEHAKKTGKESHE